MNWDKVAMSAATEMFLQDSIYRTFTQVRGIFQRLLLQERLSLLGPLFTTSDIFYQVSA